MASKKAADRLDASLPPDKDRRTPGNMDNEANSVSSHPRSSSFNQSDLKNLAKPPPLPPQSRRRRPSSDISAENALLREKRESFQKAHARSGSVPPDVQHDDDVTPVPRPRHALKQRPMMTPPPLSTFTRSSPSKKLFKGSSDVDISGTPFGHTHKHGSKQQQQQQRSSWKNRANKWQWLFSRNSSKEHNNNSSGDDAAGSSGGGGNANHSQSSRESSAGSKCSTKPSRLKQESKRKSPNVSCPDISSASSNESPMSIRKTAAPTTPCFEIRLLRNMLSRFQILFPLSNNEI